jgi:hypothetical protein
MAFEGTWELRCAGCLLALMSAVGCGDSKEEDVAPPPEGYIRYTAPAVTVPAGQNGQWLQWVAEPADHDRNIDDVIGYQGRGGHHAILYTTKQIEPVGTTTTFKNDDQANIQFVGGVGGEGGDSLVLPKGVVFRVPAGRALAIQTHYYNVSDAPIEGNSHIDVKFSEPSPDDKVARFFSNSWRKVSVPPHQDSQHDATCVLQKALPLLMFANHMHEMGMSITTSIAEPGGAPRVLKADPKWYAEQTFNPDYTLTDANAPVVLPAGSTLTTHCEWRNTSGETLSSPDEMCVFFAFYFGDKDASCSDGTWRE